MSKRIKVFNWASTWSGARVHHRKVKFFTLPSTLDSMLVKEHNTTQKSEHIDGWFVAKPLGAYNRSIISRFYHAYLVLFNKAGAWQYSSDHLDMAVKRKMYKTVEYDSEDKQDE